MAHPTRRTMMTAAGAMALSAAAPGLAVPARAKALANGHQAPGFYRTKVGEIEVTIMHDGARTFSMPDSFVTNVSHDDALAAAGDAFMPAGKVTVPFNPTLINTGTRLVLIDTGNGPSADGRTGQLFANFEAADTDVDDVDLIVLSHLHPDHINGLLTAKGAPAFVNASIVAPAAEWAFWMSDDNMARASDPVTKDYFTSIRKVMDKLKDQVDQYQWGSEVAAGVTAIATPGHTPGHTSFAIASGDQRVLVQSDVTNIPELFLRNPDWHVMYDHAPDEAAATRHKFYDMAATERTPVIGYHFAFPSIGHVEKAGTGYRLVPAAWSGTL